MIGSYAVPGLPRLARTLVMGVVNVTPDSFSDGGRYVETASAVAHGLELAAQGADIIDVGGESTRPGAERIDQDVEIARVLPVVRELVDAGVIVSVDSMRAAVAEAALDAGAVAVNDVSGGLADPAILKVVAAAEVAYITVHSRGPSIDMQARASYDDVVSDVCTELIERVHAAREAGIERDRIVVDPGLGFAKTGEHNWALLRGIDALAELGYPLLIGASRKAFLGRLLGSDDRPRPVDERDDATTAISAFVAAHGVWGVRVHDVRGSADAVRVVAQLTGPSQEPA
jgi:dihydropteroate synthase